MSFYSNLKSNIFPFICATMAEKTILKSLNTFKLQEFSLDKKFKKSKIAITILEKLISKEYDRNKIIEDKVKSTLVTLAVSASIMIGTIPLLIKEERILALINTLPLAFSLIYLLSSLLSAVSALDTRGFYDYRIGDMFEIKESILIEKKMTNNEKVEFLYYAIKCNEYTINIRSNFASASYLSIRNGIIFLFIFYCFIIIFSKLQYIIDSIQIDFLLFLFL